jgi:hypothetical protein
MRKSTRETIKGILFLTAVFTALYQVLWIASKI